MSALANQPAFPGGITSPSKPSDDCYPTQEGVSVRQHVAIEMMKSLVIAASSYDETLKVVTIPDKNMLASRAVDFADALIAKLEETK